MRETLKCSHSTFKCMLLNICGLNQLHTNTPVLNVVVSITWTSLFWVKIIKWDIEISCK